MPPVKDSLPKPQAPAAVGLQQQMPRKRKLWLFIAGGIAAVLLLAFLGAFLWYKNNTEPVQANAPTQLVKIAAGDTADSIAKRLVASGLIRSELAFKIALRLDGRASHIKSGAYRLSAAQSVAQIIDRLTSGQIDAAVLLISPGITLKTARKQFIEAGFSEQAVDAAFAKSYEHPLLQDKPSGTTLEGYLYPDTYFIDIAQSPEVTIEAIFDNFYKKIQESSVLPELQAKGFNLYQALTLGSIIGKEVSGKDDRAHVAQVFLKRLSIDMPLGADATFMYAAEVLNRPPSVTIDSPYNTRVHTGLPPGPIANVDITSLIAIAHPTATDDLYFVSGDDGKNYFSKTLEEHEENIAKYCIQKCQL